MFARGADVLLVPALVLTSLNSSGSLSFIASPGTKVLSVLLALAAATIVLLGGRGRMPTPAFWLLVALLASELALTSLIRQVPVERYLLLGQYLAQLAAILVWVLIRPQRLLPIMFTVSVVHMVLAVAFHTYVPWEEGGTRLGGGSHPIQLGFEASLVIVISLVVALQPGPPRRRAGCAVLAVFGAYVLLQAFSRQALIAESVALVVLACVMPGAFRWVRAFLALALSVVVFVVLGADGIASLLGAQRASDLSSATGRTDIWARILTFFPDFAGLGYGYSSLNDSNGPDTQVVFASHGAPAENALLQVTLDGGVLAAIIWIVMLIAGVAVVARARGISRIIAIAVLPIFLSSITVASGLSGVGIQWWWFLAIIAEAGASAMGRPNDRTIRSRIDELEPVSAAR